MPDSPADRSGSDGRFPAGLPRDAGQTAQFPIERRASLNLDCDHIRPAPAPLADGLLGGNALICPLRAWKFDLSTAPAHCDQGCVNSLAWGISSKYVLLGRLVYQWRVR